MTSRTLDGLDRLTQVTYQDGSTRSFTWDAGNRLTQAVDSISGTITRVYDGLDRLTQEVTSQGTVSYTYDAAGRRTSMTVLGQSAINYTYDNADRLTQITQGTSTVTVAYDTAGRRTSLALPNGVSTEYSWDAASRLTGLTYKNGGTTLGSLTYAFDAASNRTVVGGTWARTGLPATVSSASYNAANQQLTFGGQTLAYDLNGNLTSDGTTTSTWDARNRLASLSGPGVTASFQYDPLGRRPSKTVNGTTTSFLYNGLNPVQEQQGGNPTANLLTSLAIDEYLTRTDGAGQRGFFSDAIGSTVALTDSTGAVATSYTYEPFGATTLTGAASSNSFDYTGRESDGTGLKYYRARYYHPGLQRFIAEDPLGFLGGDPNMYAYGSGDPINRSDPLGLTAQSNWNFFLDWALERRPAERFYGPNTLETQEMIKSPGVQAMRDAFSRGQCTNIQIDNYDSLHAYVETVPNPTSTAFQVGGFVYSAVNTPSGQVRYRIYNQASMHSFFLHAPGMPHKPRGGAFPFMGNIDQTFEWMESNPCGSKSSR